MIMKSKKNIRSIGAIIILITGILSFISINKNMITAKIPWIE